MGSAVFEGTGVGSALLEGSGVGSAVFEGSGVASLVGSALSDNSVFGWASEVARGDASASAVAEEVALVVGHALTVARVGTAACECSSTAGFKV